LGLDYGSPVLWSIGDPTDQEQSYLEFINRSRANPPAEGLRLANTTDPEVLASYSFFSVDLEMMKSQFNAIAAVPPLAMNAQLLAAARLHSGDMFTNQFQGHDGSSGSGPGQRITAQGYPWTTYGENVFAYAESAWHGHAGFNVDWGYGPGGMQSPPGHRNSIHNANFREVGIGVVNGMNGSIGPQTVTQDFASRGNIPMITGVAYYDLNGNSFYDLGEGIGGITVNVPGSAYYAVTAASGGYAIPVTTNGNYQTTFTASGLSTSRVATVTSGRNVKIDIVPNYTPPTISGPASPAIGASNVYTFGSVGAAIGYEWERTLLQPYTAVEGAENGAANVTISASAGYSVIDSAVEDTGSYSFHLAHPSPPVNQYITLNPVLRLGANSVLAFSKRLGWASTDQVARAQISTDGGATWVNLWSQAGLNGSGESIFTRVTNSLAPYAGMSARIRFVYAFAGGSYYSQTSSGTGLYLDNISISDAQLAATPVISATSSLNHFAFTPTNAGPYQLRVRALLEGRTMDWGPAIMVNPVQGQPTITLSHAPAIAAGQAQVNFTVANFQPGMTFQLWKASELNGAWSMDNSATLQTIQPGSQFRFTTATSGAAKLYFQVRAQ
jgi:hypothetical protein